MSHVREVAGPIPQNFAPVRMAEVELGLPLPALEGGAGELGIPYRTAQCLVRLHGRPLGFVGVDLSDAPVTAQALAEQIWSRLETEIRAHLGEDGTAAPKGGLSAQGLPSEDGVPRCRQRDAELERTAPFVSVVIPTRNRPDSARQTVERIAESNYARDGYEIILVDNGSGSDVCVSQSSFDSDSEPSVRVLSEPEPGGSNARNRGLLEASGEIVVFADDDVQVDPDWLTRMVAPMSDDERVGGVAGLTVPFALETPAQTWFEGFGGFMRGFERRVYDLADPPRDRPLFPFTVGDLGSGQNMAFRRDVLRGLGGFDTTLGPATVTLAGEDLDAMLRVLLANQKVVYEPAAIVRHEHQREYDQFRRRMWGYGVGLTACLTKAIVENPSQLGPLLVRKLPRGLSYALSPRSGKNAKKQRDYPAELTRLELRGMLYGPLAYARSRSRRRGRRVQRAGESEGGAGGAGPSKPGSLRVLIVTDSHPPLIGGANRSVELLSRHLVEMGHTVAIATAWQEGLPAFEQMNGAGVHRIRDLASRARWISADPFKHNPPPFPDPEAVVELRRLIRRYKPDLVHAYGWLAHSAAAAIAADEVPLLLSARDYGNICAVRTLVRKGNLCSGPAPLKCLDCAASHYGGPKGVVSAISVLSAPRLLRRRLTAVHSVSRYVAGQMDSHLKARGVISRVIPNFHEDTSAEPVDKRILAQLPEEPFILFVGAFRRIKGIEELLHAYRTLEDPPPLVLVGTRSPDTPEPFPPTDVTVIEDVPHPTVMAMWERAAFGVLPTRAPEPLGNVVHEAMSKGRPMIGTRPGGQEDMISDGENGLLVPGGDSEALAAAMATLIRDPALRERFGKRARERARDFTPEIVMPQIERLYHDTVERFRQERV
jgi:glycosyltransferase involved in cell wall biosynthesis/GT2 family glycosyltransferase